MANTVIQIKKSTISGNVPVSLATGELAINSADGKLYYKTSSGSTAFIYTPYTFSTVCYALASGVSEDILYQDGIPVGSNNTPFPFYSSVSTNVTSALMGPYGVTDNYPWDPNGVVGVRRFLERVWRLQEKLSSTNFLACSAFPAKKWQFPLTLPIYSSKIYKVSS